MFLTFLYPVKILSISAPANLGLFKAKHVFEMFNSFKIPYEWSSVEG